MPVAANTTSTDHGQANEPRVVQVMSSDGVDRGVDQGADEALESAPARPAGSGQGELLLHRGHTRGDAAMIEMAIRRGWPIGRKAKRAVVKRLLDVMETTDSDRDCIAAARALIAADAINVQQAKPQQRPSVAVQVNVTQAAPQDRATLADAARVLRRISTDPPTE